LILFESMPQLTWLITGCSSGIGEQFVLGALARGDRVIATARKDVSRLKHLENAGAAVSELDVTSPPAEIKGKMAEILNIYDGVDVLSTMPDTSRAVWLRKSGV
jgi:NAD(P)-dependent dehydrogenase (short-subunit alcohol dehydrogenase family)